MTVLPSGKEADLPTISYMKHFPAATVLELQSIMKAFRNKLARLAKAAEDLHNLASPQWIPKICSYINTCHYLEYHLRQSQLPLLLLYDSSSPAPSPQTSRGATPVPLSPDPQNPAMTPNNVRLVSPYSISMSTISTPESSMMEANTDRHGATGLVGAYEPEAGALGSFWKKWALKMARAIVTQFALDSRSYKHRSRLAEFSNTSYSQQEG